MLAELADDLAYGIGNLRSRLRRQEAEATIHRMACCDALTGLPNRVSLCERFESVLFAVVAQNQPLALMSLDHLQEVNDALGYVQGDRLIQTFARRLIHARLRASAVTLAMGCSATVVGLFTSTTLRPAVSKRSWKRACTACTSRRKTS